MKLTLRRTITKRSVKIEDEIHLEDDSPPMVLYHTPNNEKIDSFDNLPFDNLDHHIRAVISTQVTISFPLIEKLCREIFNSESES